MDEVTAAVLECQSTRDYARLLDTIGPWAADWEMPLRAHLACNVLAFLVTPEASEKYQLSLLIHDYVSDGATIKHDEDAAWRTVRPVLAKFRKSSIFRDVMGRHSVNLKAFTKR